MRKHKRVTVETTIAGVSALLRLVPIFIFSRGSICVVIAVSPLRDSCIPGCCSKICVYVKYGNDFPKSFFCAGVRDRTADAFLCYFSRVFVFRTLLRAWGGTAGPGWSSWHVADIPAAKTWFWLQHPYAETGDSVSENFDLPNVENRMESKTVGREVGTKGRISYPEFVFLSRAMCRMSWSVCVFSSLFFSSSAILLGSHEFGEGVGWVVKAPEFSSRKRKAKNECVFLPTPKKESVVKTVPGHKAEYNLLSLRPALHSHYVSS